MEQGSRYNQDRGIPGGIRGGCVFVLQLISIVFFTLILGTLGILSCLLIPRTSSFMKLARLWSWLVLKTVGVRFSASYHPKIDLSKPGVYVANHQSQLDVPALVLAMPVDFRFVAKRELAYIPVSGWAIWLAGFVMIDRSDRDRAIRSLERASHR